MSLSSLIILSLLSTAAVLAFTPQHRSLHQKSIIKMTDVNAADITEQQRAKGAFKYVEDVAPGLRLEMDLNTIHHTSVSEFQQVQVIDSYFGKTLITDGKTQSAEHDEFVYHETLVHPALFWSSMLSPDKSGPKTVFIGGGGELATAREVLRHTSIEKCVMVDIDPLVVDVCAKYLPEWGGEAVLKHPKMNYIVGDAHKYLMETEEKFDVIIMDISDPVEAGPGIALYTQEFYKRAAEVLNEENGVFVTQAGSADFVPHPHAFPEEGHGEEENKETCCFSPIKNTLATVFDHAIPFSCPVASFGEDWGFVLAFNGPPSKSSELINVDAQVIDEMIEDRIRLVPGVPVHRYRSKGVKRAIKGDEKGSEVLKHYDGVSHRRLFALSKMLREAMKSDERIMTVDNPIFMY